MDLVVKPTFNDLFKIYEFQISKKTTANNCAFRAPVSHPIDRFFFKISLSKYRKKRA